MGRVRDIRAIRIADFPVGPHFYLTPLSFLRDPLFYEILFFDFFSYD